ncbi:DNA polymerase epsilon catalytic subunit A-like [Dorcoceras hygrometricum]|uniref:DNA polymerase epsilon catalytic subunit A-like n=1 Tax=Dorcoceras hygrometricum TaxID=472368 RepID=A0A2Z6ZRW7_9LAMI|nr:DNA polymerase epsilon catalytic subunit A-like [Dorcoceras hygrometricum]
MGKDITIRRPSLPINSTSNDWKTTPIIVFRQNQSLTTVANNLSKLDNQTLLRNTRAGQPVDRTLKSLKGKPSTGPQNGVAPTYPNDVAHYQQLGIQSQDKTTHNASLVWYQSQRTNTTSRKHRSADPR